MWLLLVYRIMKVTNNWTGHHEIIRLRAMDWKLTRPCTSEWVTHLLVWVTDRRQPIPTGIIQSNSLNRLSHWGSESVAVPWEVLGHVMLCVFWSENEKKKPSSAQHPVHLTSPMHSLTETFMWSLWWGHNMYGGKRQKLFRTLAGVLLWLF